MNTTRRRYLRGIGGGSALLVGGCLDRSPPGGDGGDGGGGQNGTRPEGTGGPGVTVVSVDDELDLPITPSVEVVCEAATESSPPRIRTILQNTSDDPIRIGEGRAAHFEYVSDDSGALAFLPAAGDFSAEPGCWRLSDPVSVTEEYRTIEIDAGESSGRLVDLYATPGEDACLPVGEYRFETAVSVGPPESDHSSSDRWGLTVLLE